MTGFEVSLDDLLSSLIKFVSLSFALWILFFLMLFPFKDSISFPSIKDELFTLASDEVAGFISSIVRFGSSPLHGELGLLFLNNSYIFCPCLFLVNSTRPSSVSCAICGRAEG